MRDDSGLSMRCGAFTVIHSFGITDGMEKTEFPFHHLFSDLPINHPHPVMSKTEAQIRWFTVCWSK